ncbi:TIGR01906 family membrane protein [Chloroflexota bacterium]
MKARLKIISIPARWLFILCLPILLLTAGISWTTNSLWLYKYGFQKFGVNQTTGLTTSELEKVAIVLIDYFNSGEEYVSLAVTKQDKTFTLFNQREIAHLKDIKGLIWLDYWVLLGTLVSILTYVVASLLWWKDWRRLARGVFTGTSLSLALMIALGMGTLLGFDQLFLQFHLISFSNELWQLDPTKDYLIMLFPRGFFYDAALLFAGVTSGLALILCGMARGYLHFSRIMPSVK